MTSWREVLTLLLVGDALVHAELLLHARLRVRLLCVQQRGRLSSYVANGAAVAALVVLLLLLVLRHGGCGARLVRGLSNGSVVLVVVSLLAGVVGGNLLLLGHCE